MQKDLKELLSIIKIKIFGETGIEAQDVTVEEAEKIFRLAKKHDFAHLLDAFHEESEDFNSVNENIKKEKNLALYRYTKQSIELENLKSLFESEKIEYMPLKGYVIKPFYPEPWMRTSSDIDVLIDKKNLTKVEKVLQEKILFQWQKEPLWFAQLKFIVQSVQTTRRYGCVMFYSAILTSASIAHKTQQNSF